MNIADSERIATMLEKMGYTKTSNESEADLVAIIMCSVRQSAVDRVHWLAEKFRRMKNSPKTILTGCILQKDKKIFKEKFDQVWDMQDIDGFLEIMPRHSSQPATYVPIMTGCNNFCSYCVVPYTRGREVSRPAKKIVKEIKLAVKDGAKEVWLLGQNVNSYKDKKVKFPELLKMVDNIPGNFVLNFTSSHPKDFSDELIDIMAKCKKLSRDLNLPIQSGDDKILKKMNRPYTVAQYKNLVKRIRKAIPNVRLSTDIIVGFPGETKKQFENTVKVLKDIGYGVAFINKYSPRAGTAAEKMKDNVSWAEKKRREKVLIDLINAKHKK